MDKSKRKIIIGVLGGVGSGKSTVAEEFVKLGCKSINADKLAHELLASPAIQKQITDCLGTAVLGADGCIDRYKMANIVFDDPQKLAKLNSILHPPILKRAEELIDIYNKDQAVKAIVLDFPLLVEVGWDKKCDRLIFVDCDQQTREKRVAQKAVLCEKAAKNPQIFEKKPQISPDFQKNYIKIRENFQISLDKKADLAENTIDNNSDFSALADQVKRVFSEVMGNF